MFDKSAQQESLIKGGIFILIISTCWGTNALAQKNNFQNWNSVGAKIALSKKTALHISELGSFLPSNNFQLNFTQTQIGLSYNVSKIFSLMGGDQLNYIPNSSRSLRNRIFFRGSVNTKLSTVFKTEHALQVEFHDKNERNYSKRLIFINKVSLRTRFSPLHLQPSVSYWLYYNIGGRKIQYYDETGNVTALQTPDGFHRGRLFISLNSKINKTLSLTVYYLNQQEFNLFTSANRNINFVNPTSGKIIRPYNNFNALGLSLQFLIGKH